MFSKTLILLFGVSLVIFTTDVSAQCRHHIYRRTMTYEVVPVSTCGGCGGCAMPCMFVEEYEYYNSPIRTSHRGSQEMSEYSCVGDP